jgi:hypothetical protein
MRTVEEIKADIERCASQRKSGGIINNSLEGMYWAELFNTVTYGISLDRLEEICNAERGGRCIVMPCRVGDTVYTHNAVEVIELHVEWITIDSGLTVMVSFECEYECDGCPFCKPYSNYEAGDGGCDGESGWWTFGLNDFGKTVFLTRPEAEAALNKSEASK